MDPLVHCPVFACWTPFWNTSLELLKKPLASAVAITNSIVLSSAPANRVINYALSLSSLQLAAGAINAKALIAFSQGVETDAMKTNGSPTRTLPVRQQQTVPSNSHHAASVCVATFIWASTAMGEGILLSDYFYLITSIYLYWFASCSQISIKLQMPEEP